MEQIAIPWPEDQDWADQAFVQPDEYTYAGRMACGWRCQNCGTECEVSAIAPQWFHIPHHPCGVQH